MTPAARVSAAISVLDTALAGAPVEKVLTNWGRRNRYAGSGDRAAVRDLVFDILRQKRSSARAGGFKGDETAPTPRGRQLMIGYLRQSDQDISALFTGGKYAPAPLDPDEGQEAPPPQTWPDPVRLDFPDWLEPDLRRSLGRGFEANLAALRHRAPVFLRVNARKATPERAIAMLADEGIATRGSALARNALEVTENPRRLSLSKAYKTGLVELQDAASQAVIEALPIPQTGRILDFCAGGGGKALALAALTEAPVFAHDISPARMHDLPARADRAGAKVVQLTTHELRDHAPFDLVLCDAPCSGSGAWRRAPAGKWALSPARLDELVAIQADILRDAAKLVANNGILAYATCSILDRENSAQVSAFISENSMFTVDNMTKFTPKNGGDGMFCASLRRN